MMMLMLREMQAFWNNW